MGWGDSEQARQAAAWRTVMTHAARTVPVRSRRSCVTGVRRSPPGDRSRCRPQGWPAAPGEPGRLRDEAQQGRGGAAHRLGAGLRPVAPRGKPVWPGLWCAPASWLPAASAPAGAEAVAGGVALLSTGGVGTAAANVSSPWRFAGPLGPGFLGLGSVGRRGGAPRGSPRLVFESSGTRLRSPG